MGDRLRVLVLACVASGCGTIVHGRYDEVEINTRPAGAEVLVDGVSKGKSPLKTTVESDQTHTVVVRAPGYVEQTIRTDRMIGGGYIVLDILLGLVWVAVDAATGAWYSAQPNPMNVWLQPVAGAAGVSTAQAEAKTP